MLVNIYSKPSFNIAITDNNADSTSLTSLRQEFTSKNQATLASIISIYDRFK